MRLLLALITILGLQSAVFASDKLSRFERAEQMHMEKRFKEAITLWEREVKARPYNPSVYFNLGLAYKAEKNYPKAIWAFEKTLKLQPKDSEAIQMIEACYAEMDNNLSWKDETGTFQRALIAMGSDFWSILAIVFSVLGGLCVILAKRTKINVKRKWYAGTVVFSVITLFVCVANASSSYRYEHESNYAIVLDDIELSESSDAKQKKNLGFKPGSKISVEKWHRDGSASVKAFGQTIQITKGLAKI